LRRRRWNDDRGVKAKMRLRRALKVLGGTHGGKGDVGGCDSDCYVGLEVHGRVTHGSF